MTPYLLAAPLAYAGILALHRLLPARHVAGYVRGADGEPLRYRLNGPAVLLATVSAWAGACRAGWLAWDGLYVHGWASFAGACALGLAYTAAVVLPAPPTGRGLAADLFLGRIPDPQAAGIDAKMALYLIGAVMLALNLGSALAHHVLAFGPSRELALYTALFGFFVCEYLVFERVHLYTYDFVAEWVGFKLGWGCLAFYPYFYAVGAWAEAGRPAPGAPLWSAILAAACFFAGWGLSRGANLQKYRFKTRPTAPFLGIAPDVVTDGRRSLLVSGFWGVSRHVNYLGELGMAVGLTLALGRPSDPLPWLYPLYYVALLVPRQWDDDRRCAEKYGPLWDAYRARVRWRIVPGLY
ncbi:MAG: ergosterol biosynthesis protein [Myxococcota bacterium]